MEKAKIRARLVERGADAADAFDADVALATGELARMIAQLLNALGGQT